MNEIGINEHLIAFLYSSKGVVQLASSLIIGALADK